MTMGEEQLNGHERFSELCALAMSGALTARGVGRIEGPFADVPECREAYREYRVLTEEGIPHLAARYGASARSGKLGRYGGAAEALCARRRGASTDPNRATDSGPIYSSSSMCRDESRVIRSLRQQWQLVWCLPSVSARSGMDAGSRRRQGRP